ncbi:ABC transporter substrate-binding protein [Dolosicoccus paucivorans]|uniref:ABC transporter substrate-binding protein n=1 Tax=Dolosicoccus paucivorans TaxID=84521 RepID=UPI000882DF66|nr:ABC transporter substrate-binding protein [Dolosicoccus paucivorans]SDI20518.1 putative ABC transport system substrate-binding protein [Dolosicoccus paucivorans]
MKRLLKFISVCLLIMTSFMQCLPSTKAAEEIKIGILQFVEHDAFDATVRGLKERMETSEFKDQIKWDIQNAQGDNASLQSISERIARDNDLLIAIGTAAGQALAHVESQKPVFFAAVTAPVEAGLVKSLDRPETNFTGTSNLAPIDKQVELLVNSFPDIKTVGILYDSSAVNSVVQVEIAKKELENKGIKVEEQTVTSTNDVHQAMSAVARKVDGLFMVTDNTIDSAIQLVKDIALENKLPMIGTSKEVIEKHGLATMSNSYEDYGRQTADMIIRMLEDDLNVSQMPVEMGKDFELVVNEENAKKLGIDPKTISLPN